MAEIFVDDSLNQIKVLDKEKELVIKAKNIFSAHLCNDNFVWVLTDANTSDEKRTLYNIDGEIIYEFYQRKGYVRFMGNELKSDIRIGVVAYYPPKKFLLVCGSYQDENVDKENGSCIYIYDTEHKIVKIFDEKSDFEGTKYSYYGVGCEQNNRVDVSAKTSGDFGTLRMALDMDTYKLTKISYDPR